MQDLLQNKGLLVFLAILIAAAIYMGVTGQFGTGGGGDLPSELMRGDYAADTGAPSTPSPAVDTTPPPAAAPPDGAAASGLMVSPGQPESPSSTPTPPPTPAPSQPSSSMGINEKLLAFKNIDPKTIIDDKYDELEKDVTDPEKFAEDIGRVDPLTVVSDFMPPELRPPRKGETNDEQITAFLQEARAHDVLSRISLDIRETINAGNQWFALIRFNEDSEPVPYPVGQPFSIFAEGLLVRGVIVSASRTKVVYELSWQGPYSSASRTVTMLGPGY